MPELTQLEAPPTAPPPRAPSCTPSPRTPVLWLQSITVLWMLVELAVSARAAFTAHSPALLAFASDSLVELLSATVVLLQFLPGRRVPERVATRAAAILLYALAAIVAVIALTALVPARSAPPQPPWHRDHPGRTDRHAHPRRAQAPPRAPDGQRRPRRRRSPVRHLRLPRPHHACGPRDQRHLPRPVVRRDCRALPPFQSFSTKPTRPAAATPARADATGIHPRPRTTSSHEALTIFRTLMNTGRSIYPKLGIANSAKECQSDGAKKKPRLREA